MSDRKRYVVGIDGGGSKTHGLLVGMDGTILGECTAGPANLMSLGIPKSAHLLYELIQQCCGKDPQCTPESLDSTVLGIAGAGRANDRAELVNEILALGLKHKFPLKNVTVETDARIALEAGLAGQMTGIVVIAGTGSIALYRTPDRRLLRAGGWGNILGDEGSGFAIGRDALNIVMRQYDGRSEKTLLTDKALDHFGASAVDDLITKIYHDRADVAAFVPRVFEAAVERDRFANAILVRNAAELVELARVLTMQERPKQKLPVVLMGGLVETENVYSKLVREKIAHSLPQVVIQKPKFPAAFGAAIIGLNAFR